MVNDGAFDLIRVSIPPGTILSPIRPAALSCRTHLLGRLFDVMGALFGQRQPEFLSAAGYSDSPHLFYSGWTKDGEWFQVKKLSPSRFLSLLPKHSFIKSDSGYVLLLTWRCERHITHCALQGIPARPHGDGPDGHSMWPSMRTVPNEFLESYLPLRVDRYEVRFLEVVDIGFLTQGGRLSLILEGQDFSVEEMGCAFVGPAWRAVTLSCIDSV